jgi:hypothetical protein
MIVNSLGRRCKLPFVVPLVDLFLRGVAKLKKKSCMMKVSYDEMLHLKVSADPRDEKLPSSDWYSLVRIVNSLDHL